MREHSPSGTPSSLTKTTVLWFLLAMAFAGLAMFLLMERQSLPAPGGQLEALHRVEALQQTVASLEQELHKMGATVTSATPMTSAAPTIASRDRSPQPSAEHVERVLVLEQRLQQLAERVASLEARPASVALPEVKVREVEREAAKQLAQPQLTQKFLDRTATEAARLKALSELRDLRGTARTGLVAEAAIELALNSTDAATRADVWRQMSGAKDARLIPHLLRSLQTDASANVRGEAAETLGDYTDRPEVLAALQSATQTDPEPQVRKEAHRALSRR